MIVPSNFCCSQLADCVLSAFGHDWWRVAERQL